MSHGLIRTIRHSTFALTVCLLAGLRPGIAAVALATEQVRFEIAPQQLPSALLRYSEQSGVQITSPGELVEGKQSGGVAGVLGVRQALEQLLKNTELAYEVIDSHTVTIIPSPGYRTASYASGDAQLRLAQAEPPASGPAPQRAPAAGADADADPLRDEVIVTARRREENLQETPISIDAFSAGDMELRGMERVEDMVAGAPNVFAGGALTGAAASEFSMRGIPKVGVFVDGIWQRSGTLMMQRSTMELERIEVLRGPQGTLFGRDTTGGAIRMFTKRPGDKFGVRATVIAGTYDRLDLSANIDIPVTETFRTKWTVGREQRDGFLNSMFVDRAYGEIDDRVVRGDLYWVPNDRFNARLIGEDSVQRTSQTNAIAVINDPGAPGPGPGAGYTVPPHQYYVLLGLPYDNLSHAMNWSGGVVGDLQTRSDSDLDHGVIMDAQRLTLSLDFKLTDRIGITSLTGWEQHESVLYNDFDGSEYELLEQDDQEQEETFTQEFQIAGETGRFNWVGGVFGWNTDGLNRLFRWGLNEFALNELDFNRVRTNPLCQPPVPGTTPCILVPPSQDTFTGNNQEGHAFFGEVTYKITTSLDVTLGARYHDQESETNSRIYAADTPRRGTVPGERLPGDYFKNLGKTNPIKSAFTQDTYRFALTNRFTDDLMAYVGYAEGFNSGGVSRIRVADENGAQLDFDFPFDPEQIKNYEVGLRSEWLDGRIRANATVFKTEWNNIQLSSPTRNPLRPSEFLAAVTISNVAKAEAKGAELSLLLRPTRNLRFNADVGILDTGYTEVQAGVTEVRLGDKFGRAPDLQYSLGAQWDHDLANGGRTTVRLDYNWTDDYIRNYSPLRQINASLPGYEAEQLAFGLLNARAGFRAASGNWEVSLFGTNLTDERYTNGGFFIPQTQMDHSTLGRPREGGVSIKIFFE